ncbi:MAG TPA: signal recognition particle protein [Anaerolineae bacterium]|nr:signal recognition particle protein [Anaerolineae bacterium]HID83664.1 signal recognition particle protein [Anaerolineales bacterium]HIQ07914.1 signal recognition particle protein [Anaerolineaceae bacterium]
MFDTLTERLNTVFQNLRRRGKLSEQDVDAALREVRLALLEADVHYKVVKDFLARVRERAIGREVSRALNPAQQVVKIVNEELIATLGDAAPLNLKGPRPRVVMLVGLQGSGKTTTAAKLALRLKQQGQRVLLVAADPYRPAAVQQLQTLGQQLDVPVYHEGGTPPPELAARAREKAAQGGFDTVIVDTAGRSQLDEALMDEIRAMAERVQPSEVLLVVDAMVGQEAVRVAESFRDAVPLTGLVLTKMDGDARGGAAISIRSVTGVPIKLLGTGERVEDLEVYDPARLASRILGMGDVLGLIERAEQALDAEEAARQAERMLSGEFTLEDFAVQLRQLRRLGSLGQILEMLPGQWGKAARQISPQEAERQLKRVEAILNSMTPEERRHPDILNASRRRRIARGSGTTVEEVNRLMKQYREMRRLMKHLKKTGLRGFPGLF